MQVDKATCSCSTADQSRETKTVIGFCMAPPSRMCLWISSRHCSNMGVGHTISVAPQGVATAADALSRVHRPHTYGPAAGTIWS